ncbi:MAG: Ig-like domain-containing protein [Planctomycetota bacterium]
MLFHEDRFLENRDSHDGLQDSNTALVAIDNCAPTISALNPLDGSWIADRRPTISATFADAFGVDADSVRLTLDGNDVSKQAVCTTKGCSVRMLLAEGAHSAQVDVTDLAGNHSSATWTFQVDSIGPEICFVQPDDGLVTNNRRPIFSGSFSDAAPGSGIALQSAKLLLDNEDVTQLAQVAVDSFTFQPLADLTEGDHTLTMSISDCAGSKAILSRSIIVDTTAPTEAPDVTHWSEEAGQVFFAGNPPIEYGLQLLARNIIGDVQVWPKLFENAFVVTCFGNSGALPVSFSADLYYRDVAGNAGSVTVIRYPFAGNPPPQQSQPLVIASVTVDIPQNKKKVERDGKTLTNSDNVTFNVSASGGTAPLSLIVNNGRPSANMSYTAWMPEGEQRYVITVSDKNEQSASKTVGIVSDRTPPRIRMETPLKATTMDLQCLVLGPADKEPVRHDSASIQRVEDPSRFGLQEPSSYPDGGKRRKGGH